MTWSRWPLCPKCGFHKFEINKARLRNSDSELTFVQCSSCGVAVGVIDTYMLEKVNGLIDKIKMLEEAVYGREDKEEIKN